MRERIEKVVIAGDGTRLYARETRGPDARGTPLICANGIGVSTFFWKYVEADFAAERPVIVWDYRGHGRSEFPRDLDDLTMESNAADLARVLDAFGHERAIALGHSMGCQVVYQFAHQEPGRAAALVPMLGTYGRPVHTFLGREASSLASFMIGHRVGTAIPGVISGAQRRLLSLRIGRRLVSQLARRAGLVHPEAMPQADLEEYLDHFAVFSPLVFFRMAEKMAVHTAGPYLEQIQAPTLVVAGERDIFTPLWLSEEAADRLPTAELLVLTNGSHAALVEQPGRITAAMRSFLLRHEVDGAAEAEDGRPAVASTSS